MQIRSTHVIIDKDMVTKLPQEPWSWEVPVLEAKYGGKVIVKDDAEVERPGLPEVEAEFERLCLCHGSDTSGVPYCEIAYGRGANGRKELAKAIKAAAVKKRRTTKKAAPKKPKAAEADAGEGDPLATG